MLNGHRIWGYTAILIGTQLTVFNDQSVIQLGGRWNPTLKRIEKPFTGVMAGVVTLLLLSVPRELDYIKEYFS